jgi:hypothetical protein
MAIGSLNFFFTASLVMLCCIVLTKQPNAVRASWDNGQGGPH